MTKLHKKIKGACNSNIVVMLDCDYESEHKIILRAGADLMISWSPRMKAGELMNGAKTLLKSRYSEKEVNWRIGRRKRYLCKFLSNAW